MTRRRSPALVTAALTCCALAGAATIPGPCVYDAHEELDCARGERCPAGLACAADGHCKDASIACDGFAGGAQLCDGVCIRTGDLASDDDNCGACGVVCGAGEGCCDGACAALDAVDRCGACDVACDAGDVCAEGACARTCAADGDCGAGALCCGDVCTEVEASDAHCGACDVACDTADERCVARTCRATCANDDECGGGGAQCCDGACAPPDDAQNCGECGRACAGGDVCLGGTCAPECAADRPCAAGECCDGRCVDTGVDDDNCGGCGAPCAGALFCHGGTCHDGSEQNCCGGACDDCTAAGDACVNGSCAACDLVDQDCGAGRTCVAVAGRAPPAGRCLASAPAPAPGRNAQCTSDPSHAVCADGLDCRRANDAVDLCVHWCLGSGDVGCVAGEHCAPLAPGSNVGVCAPACPATTSPCSVDGLPGTCAPILCATTGDGVCAVDGALARGASCDDAGDCAAGVICALGFTNRCEALCDNVGAACAGGGTCSDVLGCGGVGLCL